ncbi:hypothetical protein H4R26_005331, partial [Coemansia thaxteri]
MVYTSTKSSLPDVGVPLQDLPSFFFDRVRQNPAFTGPQARPLFTDADDSSLALTLDEIEALTSKLASGLYHNAGVRPGDMVAIIMPNSVYYVPVVLAALTLGATCTLANPSYTPRELAHQLSDSRASLAITVTSLHSLVVDAAEANADQCCSVVLADGYPTSAELPAPEARSIFDMLSDRGFPRFFVNSSRQDLQTALAFVPYSSGTTGLPKGVMLSHYNIIANILQVASVHQTNAPHPTCVAVLPMFHIFGLLFLCFAMPVTGVSTVVMRKFGMPQFLSLVAEYKVTEVMLVPPIVNALAKMPAEQRNTSLQSLRWLVVGAAPLSTETISCLETSMPQLTILQGYGMSEACPTISLNPPAARNSASVGRLVANIEAKVIDDLGRTLGSGEIGELCFRGPNIMMGYLNNPDATKSTIDVDGFLLTGDIGYIDENQFVFVTDRKKELIKFNGFQVAPAELEGILMQHPHVRDCAVKGVYDQERQTEVPRAYL